MAQLLVAGPPKADPFAWANLTRMLYRDIASEADARQRIIQQNADNYFRQLSAQNQQAATAQRAFDSVFNHQMDMEQLNLKKMAMGMDVQDQAFRQGLAERKFGLQSAESRSRIGLNGARASQYSPEIGLPTEGGSGESVDSSLFPDSTGDNQTFDSLSEILGSGERKPSLQTGSGQIKQRSPAEYLKGAVNNSEEDLNSYIDLQAQRLFNGDTTMAAIKNSVESAYLSAGKKSYLADKSQDYEESILAKVDLLKKEANAKKSSQQKPGNGFTTGSSRRTSSDYLHGALQGSAEDTQTYLKMASDLLKSGKTSETAIRNQIRAAAPDITVDLVNAFVGDIKRLSEVGSQTNSDAGLIDIGRKKISAEEAAKYYLPNATKFELESATPIQRLVTESVNKDLGAIQAVQKVLDEKRADPVGPPALKMDVIRGKLGLPSGGK